MKLQTNRIRKNTTTKTVPVQPAVGQEDAKSGHAEIRKKAVATVAEWENETAEQFINKAIDTRLRGSCDDMSGFASGKDNDRPQEKKWAEKFLPLLWPLMKSLGIEDKNLQPPLPPTAAVEEISRCDAWSLLEDSQRALIALQQLMFNAIEHENVRIFMNDNGYLAAGLQTLMWEANARFQEATDAVRKVQK